MTSPYKILITPHEDYKIFHRRADVCKPENANVSTSRDFRRSVVAYGFCGDKVDWKSRLQTMNTNSKQFGWGKQYYRIHNPEDRSLFLSKVDEMLIWPMSADSEWRYNFVLLQKDSKQYLSSWDSWYMDAVLCLESLREFVHSWDVSVGIYQDPLKTFGELRSLKVSIEDGSVYKRVSSRGLLIARNILQTFVREHVDYKTYFASTLQWFADLHPPAPLKLY